MEARKRHALELGEPGFQMTLSSHEIDLITSVFDVPTGQAVPEDTVKAMACYTLSCRIINPLPVVGSPRETKFHVASRRSMQVTPGFGFTRGLRMTFAAENKW